MLDQAVNSEYEIKSRRYDLAVVGAGPVGSLCALIHARKGARVALFEARSNGARTVGGEWLHPPAARLLQQVGINFETPADASVTKGFIYFPEDGSEPIELPYPNGSQGLACDHGLLVKRLRDTAINHPNVDLIPERVRSIDDDRVGFERSGVQESIAADLIVGADGPRSVVRRALGLATKRTSCSRMLGFELNGNGQGIDLPKEGYGSVVLGGPGPMFIYRLNSNSVRIHVDVPLRFPSEQTGDLLMNNCMPLLPEELQHEFTNLVQEKRFHVTSNGLNPRMSYGDPQRILLGDAAGHYHPSTAVGMTLGFGDAYALSEYNDPSRFAAQRFKEIRAPEMLALAFYEILVDDRVETVALRQSVYRMWRERGWQAERSLKLLSCEDTSEFGLGLVGGLAMLRATSPTKQHSSGSGLRSLKQSGTARYRLIMRIGWFIRGVRQLRKVRATSQASAQKFLDAMARALPATMQSRESRSDEPLDQAA